MNELFDIIFGMSTCLFPILFFGLAIVIIVVSTASMRRNISEGWGSLAQRTGLTLDQPGQGTIFANFSSPEMRGDYEGRAVKLWTYTVRHGRSSTRYTAMQMALKNPNNFNMSIRRQHGLDGIGKALGMQDVQIGDAAFDNEFVIKSQPEGVAKALFGGGSMVRDAVRRVPKGEISINGPQLLYKQVALETNTETLYNIMNSLREIANAIEGTTTPEREGFAEPQVKAESVWADKSTFGSEDEFGGKAEYGLGDVHDSHSNDPFYQKKPQPDLYSPTSSTSYDPFGSSQSKPMNWRPILIGAFIAFDLVCFLALAVLYFSGAFNQFIR